MPKHTIDPVHQAVMRHSLHDLRAAIDRGGAVDALDREGRTPLFYAVGEGHIAITAELLSRGANPNAQDRNLETPLHFAAREYRLEAARMLLDNGATVDVPDAHGNTALSRAVFDSQARGDVISLLLSRGANRNRTNNHGVSPADLARSIANYDVARYFAE